MLGRIGSLYSLSVVVFVMKLEHVADLHVMPSDLIKIICSAETLARMTTEELRTLIEEIGDELNFRETHA